jgi:hypothetical protein
MESTKETKEEQEDKGIVGCISESLMNANDMQAVAVLSITKDGSIMTSWAATFPERIALATHFKKAIDMEMENSIDCDSTDDEDVEAPE